MDASPTLRVRPDRWGVEMDLTLFLFLIYMNPLISITNFPSGKKY